MAARRRRIVQEKPRLLYMGVDPGSSSGGIAVIDEAGAAVQTWQLKDLTDRETWEAITEHKIARAVLERVAARPGNGVSSMFKFGASFGMLRGFLVAASIPFELVTPAKWQGALGCRTKGDKRITKEKAEQLFPHARVTHQTADALLLAIYARRTR